MTRRTTAIALLLLMPTLALAQNAAINWIRQPRAAIAKARKTDLPLMVYVLASERYRDDQIDREHGRTFRDPRVQAKARYFIPLRLSRTQHKDILDEFGFGQRANMEMSFVTPDGERLGKASAGVIADAGRFANTLGQMFDRYARKLFEDEFKPVLEDEKARPNDQLKALRAIANLRVKIADETVLKLLERERLSQGVRKQAYETLAELATKKGVQMLLKLGLEDQDRLALRALQQAPPPAAEEMLPELKAGDDEFEFIVYDTVTKICRVDEAKPERFFENYDQAARQEEIDRVKKIVQETAQRWRIVND